MSTARDSRQGSRAALRTALALALAGAAVLGAPQPASATEADTIHQLVNEARWASGLAGLIRNPAMDAVAEAWAAQLAQSGALAHNPAFSRQIPAGWTGAGENVARGYPDGAATHEGWMASAGHRANVLGDFTDIGIAFLAAGGTTWGVEVFAAYPGHVGPAPPAAEPPPAPPPAADPPGAEPPVAEPAPTATSTPTPSFPSPRPSTPDPTQTLSPRSVPPWAVALGAALVVAFAATTLARRRWGRSRHREGIRGWGAQRLP